MLSVLPTVIFLICLVAFVFFGLSNSSYAIYKDQQKKIDELQAMLDTRKGNQDKLDHLAYLKLLGTKIKGAGLSKAGGDEAWVARLDDWRAMVIEFLDANFTRDESLGFQANVSVTKERHPSQKSAAHGKRLYRLDHELEFIDRLIRDNKV